MQTSHFQLCLLLLMAGALGATVSPSSAVGYPATATISKGSNPIWSVGGQPAYTMDFDAPADQDIIITDIFYGSASGGWLKLELEIDGEDIAAYAWDGATDRQVVSLNSGIRIPAGKTMTARFEAYTSFGSGRYTFSGYYARP